MSNQDTQSDKTVEELIQERLKVIGDGEWTLLGVPADLVAALTARENRMVQEAELRAVREDRKANAIFWKANIDKMFDKEIAVYTQRSHDDE